MSITPQIEPRTRLFARVLGPYLLVAALTMISRTAYMRSMIDAFTADAVWPWVAGAFVLPMGLVVIALHPYWRGPAAAIVSLLGWLTVFKGIGLMVFPQVYLPMGHTVLNATPWWQIVSVFVALVGLYLTYVGWVPARSHTTSHQSVRPAPDVPHAA
jgi:hypothetical protein